MIQSDASQFQLIFQGPSDDSADTMRKIKGVFLSDLNLTIEQAQQILSEAPTTIYKSSNEEDAETYRKKLTGAGAKVLLIRPAPQEIAEPAQASAAPSSAAAESGEELTFELDLEAPVHSAPAQPKVYELSLEDSDDLPLLSAASSQDAPASIDSLLAETDRALNGGAESSLQFESEADSAATSSATAPSASASVPARPAAPSVENSLSFESPVETAAKTTAAAAHDSDDVALLDLSPEPEHVPVVQPPPEEELNLDIAAEPAREPAPAAPAKTVKPVETPPPQPTPAQPAPAQVAAQKPSDDALLPFVDTPISQLTPSTTSPDHASAPGEAPAVPLPVRPKKARGARASLLDKVPMDLVLPIGIGLLVLIVGNWVYFSSSTPAVNQKELLEMVPESVKMASAGEANPHPKEEEKKTAPPQPTAPPKTYQGMLNEAGLLIAAHLTVANDSVVLDTFQFSGAEPPPLTSEEIVRKKLRQPWLLKGELQEMQFKREPNGEFIGTGTAVLAIDYNNTRARASAPATLKIGVDNAREVLTLHLSAIQGWDDDAHAQAPLKIEPIDTSRFRVAIHGTFTANGASSQ